MATSVEQAKREETAQAFEPAAVTLPAAANENTHLANDNDRPGTDPMDFVRANRIHLEHGSLFIDPYLVIHPRELAPENETKLRQKLQLTYSINNPSFYESSERVAIALNLGQLVPVSLAAKRSKLMDEVKKFNDQVDSGADAELQQTATDKRNPFASIVRSTIDSPETDPVGVEVLKNGLGLYLMLREKLTQNHYLNRLTEYVVRSNTPDQVLQDLADKVGVSPQQVREAALEGGLDGVGKLLGLDARYVADVKQLTEYAATQDFGYNLVEHWHLGRQLLGLDASFEEKLTTGMDARITAKIAEYRGRVRHYYNVPEPVQEQEERLVREDMSVLEPIQRQLLFLQGYEICHTPENTADNIAFHKGIYGLHRRAANDLTDFMSTNRIFYSGHGSMKGKVGTLAHEVAHNMWPNYFDANATKQIDQLATDDQQRFVNLSRLMSEKFDTFDRLLKSYQVGTAEQKAAIIATANEQFAEYGITVDALFPHLKDATSFHYLVWDANDVLHVEGARYNHSGYDTPQERFREVISRYAEMRQVSHRHEPEVMNFVAPGLNKIWREHYIPHLERVYHDIVAQQQQVPAKTGVALATNVTPLVTPANDDDLPKVEERPTATGTPVTPVKVAASEIESPTAVVHKPSIQHNATTLAALDALNSMGVSPRI